MVDFHVYIPPCSFSGGSIIFNDLTYFIGDTQFCGMMLFITITPIVIAACSQPINHHCHGVDFGHWTIVVPQCSSLGFTHSSIAFL